MNFKLQFFFIFFFKVKLIYNTFKKKSKKLEAFFNYYYCLSCLFAVNQ